MPELSNPGTRLKALRSRLGIGQVDFSRAIGVPQSNLSPWESGKRTVPMPVLLAICSVYGASQAWLVDGIGPMFSAELDLSGKGIPPLDGIYLGELQGVLTAIRERFMHPGYHRLGSVLAPGRETAILKGHDIPTFAEMGVIARTLEVPISELLLKPDGTPMDVDLSAVNPLDPIFPSRSKPIPKDVLTGEPDSHSPKDDLAQRVSRLEKSLREIRKELKTLKGKQK